MQRSLERFRPGLLTLSKQGRDKDRLYVIVGRDERFVYVANGKKWTVANPKKKNPGHLQYMKTSIYIEETRSLQEIKDADIIQAIESFEKKANQEDN